jgi:peptidoglycan/LPS O-acetylase OafA/YrhL
MDIRQSRTDRYDTLDGLRGCAAILVMMHHMSPRLADVDLLPSGYLCVDFFFMLSGFIIDRRYDGKFRAGLSFGSFMVDRLRKLYPIMACGILLGAMSAVGQGWAILPAIVYMVAQLAFIPLSSGMMSPFPLNGVQWSLFFELLANAAHALILWRQRAGFLIGVCAASILLLSIGAYQFGSLAIGDRGIHFGWGIARVISSYVLGMLMSRLILLRRDPAALPVDGRWVMAALIICVGGAGLLSSAVGELASDLLVVFGLFPFILWAGVVAQLPSRIARMAGWMGAISYPLYALHLPITEFVGAQPWSAAARIALACSLTLGGAWLLSRAMIVARRPTSAYLTTSITSTAGSSLGS